MNEHDSYLELFLDRTTKLLGAEAVETLAGSCVAIAGCGGVGAGAAMTLARLGVGEFVLADPGIFDEPDGNRQWAAMRSNLGRNKAEVYTELLHDINPDIKITTYREGVTADNLAEFLRPADLVVDCLDISVPLTLRTEFYRAAQARGIYCVSSPIFGFGTLVLFAEPGGMGMDQIIEGFVEVASSESRLPPGFINYFFEPHLEAIEAEIGTHHIPSSGIAVVVSTGIICAEIALILLKEHYPDSRPPVCLPQVFVVDPLRMSYDVVDYRALFEDPDRSRATDATPADRATELEAAGHNVVLLDPEHIAIDLLSDSWFERPPHTSPAPSDTASAPLPELLRAIFGYEHNLAVFRGRFAESLLAPVLVKPGQTVIGNALFPTTRYHLEERGARIVDALIPEALDPASEHPFKANLDLVAVATHLDQGDVAAIYIEPCNNALGGHPISLENLQAVHKVAKAHGVPVVLDTTRIVTNAVLLQAREPAAQGMALDELVRALCALSDCGVGSLGKDFPAATGGFIGVNSDSAFAELRGRGGLMTGDGLEPSARRELARVLGNWQAHQRAAAERVAAVARLGSALEEKGVPVLRPAGGHAVFIDARRLLPEVPPDHNPAWAASAALFAHSGIRVAKNMTTESLEAEGHDHLRLAVAIHTRPDVEAIVAGFEHLLGDEATPGLEALPGEGGRFEAFQQRFHLVARDPS